MSNAGVDVVTTYKRIFAAVGKGKGVRLSLDECVSISCDGAAQQCVEQAEYEASVQKEGE